MDELPEEKEEAPIEKLIRQVKQIQWMVAQPGMGEEAKEIAAEVERALKETIRAKEQDMEPDFNLGEIIKEAEKELLALRRAHQRVWRAFIHPPERTMDLHMLPVFDQKERRIVHMRFEDLQFFECIANCYPREIAGRLDFDQYGSLERNVNVYGERSRVVNVDVGDFEVTYHTHPRAATPLVGDEPVFSPPSLADIEAFLSYTSYFTDTTTPTNQVAMIFTPKGVYVMYADRAIRKAMRPDAPAYQKELVQELRWRIHITYDRHIRNFQTEDQVQMYLYDLWQWGIYTFFYSDVDKDGKYRYPLSVPLFIKPFEPSPYVLSQVARGLYPKPDK